MARLCALLILTHLALSIFAKDHVQLHNKIHSSIEDENDPMSKVFDLSEYRTVSNKEAPNVEIWKLDNPKITNAGHRRDFGLGKKNGLSSKSTKLKGKEQTYKQGRKITKNQNLQVLKQKRKEKRMENRKKSKPNVKKRIFGKRVKKPMQFKSKDKRNNFKIKKSPNNASTSRQQERKNIRQQSRLRKSSKKKKRNGKGKVKNKNRLWRTIEVQNV